MTHITILVGSVYGNTLDLAKECADVLIAKSHKVELLRHPDLKQILEDDPDVLLVCTSTTGMGDIPDSLLPLFDEMQAKSQPLPDLRYGLISVGDSNYDDFAEAGWQMDRLFRHLKLKPVGEPLVIDSSEVVDLWDTAEDWLEDWAKQL